jgi:hypothetical protein
VTRAGAAVLVLAACSSSPAPLEPVPVPLDAAPIDAAPIDAAPIDAPPDAPLDAPLDAAPIDAPATPAVRPPPPRWLRGSTHVHAAPSGDARLDVPGVVAWYESHGYDFIVLTDHNRVTPIDPALVDSPAAAFPARGLVVLAGIELTYNPGVCANPAPEPDGKCRIHVNGLGVTTRPEGRIEWADRAATDRLPMYRAATRWIADAGGITQLNHPQWHWGMSPELLRALAGDGVRVMEIANTQFTRWNAGDATHLSTEQLWDDALTAGFTLWGVASDDAHDYQADGGGKYPAGGGWIMVDAPRDPAAIIAAINDGRFYASTGVALTRAAVHAGVLEIEVAATSPGRHVIRFIGAGGRVLRESRTRSARFTLADAPPGYVRAVVERTKDGARAWVQPARTPPP